MIKNYTSKSNKLVEAMGTKPKQPRQGFSPDKLSKIK